MPSHRQWGGATHPRYAQTEGSAAPPPQNACVPRGTFGCYDWTRQLGQLHETPPELVLPSELPAEPPAGWPSNIPWPGAPGAAPAVPPALPALPGGGLVVTEQQCAQREATAFQAGARSEAGKVLKTAAVSAAVSVAVGAAVGYFLR